MIFGLSFDPIIQALDHLFNPSSSLTMEEKDESNHTTLSQIRAGNHNLKANIRDILVNENTELILQELAIIKRDIAEIKLMLTSKAPSYLEATNSVSARVSNPQIRPFTDFLSV